MTRPVRYHVPPATRQTWKRAAKPW